MVRIGSWRGLLSYHPIPIRWGSLNRFPKSSILYKVGSKGIEYSRHPPPPPPATSKSGNLGLCIQVPQTLNPKPTSTDLTEVRGSGGLGIKVFWGVFVCVCVYLFICLFIYLLMYLFVYLIGTYLYIYIYIEIHTSTSTYTYIYIYICICFVYSVELLNHNPKP